MTFRNTLRASAVTVSAVIALVACSGEDTTPVEKVEDSQSSVIQPGAPGEPNRTIDPSDAPDTSEDFNQVDRDFVEMMVPHHQQAIRMGELAAQHAQDKDVIGFASRITDTQTAEIQSLQAWLETRGLPRAPVVASAEHAKHMKGMLSDAQFAELEAARGKAFDKLYLQRMIKHHEGAIEMADTALTGGTDSANRLFASDVAVVQSVEIDRLQQVLDRL